MTTGNVGAARPCREDGGNRHGGACRSQLALAAAGMAAAFALAGAPAAQAQAARALTSDPFIEQQRQLERERALRKQQEPAPDVRLQPEAPKTAERLPAEDQDQPCQRIDQLRLVGEEAERFQWLLGRADLAEPGAASLPAGSVRAAGYAAGAAGAHAPGPSADSPLGRCIGTRGVNIVLARLQQALIEAGWVTTRVLAAPQDLSGGQLTLTLVPGRIAAIRAAQADQPMPRTLRSALPAREGELLNLRDIEQGLENFKRLASAEVNIRIEPAADPGAGPGRSDLVIDYKQRFPLRATLSLDDGGTDATGRNQAGATIAWDGPLGLNDLAYINVNHDVFNHTGQDTDGYTAHYSVPWGHWLLAATGSAGSYRQTVAGAFENYVYAGDSTNAQLSLTRSLYRDATRKTSASVEAFQRTSRSYIDDAEIENQARRLGGWGLGVQHREYFGQATLDLNLRWRQFTGAFGATRAPEEICRANSPAPELCGTGTSHMRLLNADVALAIPWRIGEQRFRYGGLWRVQWNRTPVVNLERFAIGGRYSVRGFDGEANLMGDRGWLVRNDIGWLAGQSGAEIYLGLDYGEVGGPSAAWGLGNHLAGAVIGVRGAYGARGSLGYDLFVGTPIAKPEGFPTAHVTAGFSLTYSF